MFKLTTKRTILFVLTSILLVSTCLVLILLNSSRVSKAECLIDGTLESEYFIGQEVVVPNGTFEIENQSVPATHEVILPNGSVISSNKFVADQTGNYTIRYSTKVSNKTYFNEKQFKVFNYLYEVVGGGSAVYGAEEKLNGNKGLKVSLTDDAIFKLNKKVNLNNIDNDEPFIKMHINPEMVGVPELDRIFIKITDAYDEKNFFAIELKYFSSRTTSATDVGVFGYINDFTTVYTDDVVCIPQQAEWSGWIAKASFVGNDETHSLESQSLSFYFNSSLQKIYGMDVRGIKTGVLSLGSFSNKWKELTTGDVYISIFGDSFRSTYANLFIDSIVGVDFENNKLVDDNAPKITIEYGEFTNDTYPSGYVGETYPLYNAKAFDEEDGFVNVQKSVYYNYYSDSRAILSVIDNKFKPNREGVYTIVYTATDRFGNVATEYVDINVLSALSAPKFSYEVHSEYVTECKVGQIISLPYVTFSGEVGYKTNRVSITKGDKEFSYNEKNNKFTVVETGDYKIAFSAVDFLGRTSEFSYTLKAEVSDLPLFVDDVEKLVCENFIAGYLHKLPDVKAVMVDANNNLVDVPVRVTTNNGVINDGYITPERSGEIKLTFTAEHNGKINELVVERKVYSITDTDGIDMKSMFIHPSNIQSVYTEDGFAEYKVTGTGKIQYLNTVLSENAFVKIQTDSQYNDIYELNIYLYNSVNKEKFIKLTIKNFDGLAFTSVNGQEYAAIVNGDFSGNNAFEIKYSDSAKVFSINGLNYFAEQTFDGLGSDFAVMQIEAVGVSNHSVFGMIIEKVGNQPLKNDTVIDISKPVIACFGVYGGSYKINSTYAAPRVIAKDAISPELKSFTMSISAPDGSYVIIDGQEMKSVSVRDVELQLSSYGSYLFEYVAVDNANRKETFSYSVNVLDEVAPEVSIDGDYTKVANINEKVDIADFEISDNYSSDEELTKTILVLHPNGTYKIVNDNFTPDVKGRYTVYYYVTDGFGNVGLSYYFVEVE